MIDETDRLPECGAVSGLILRATRPGTRAGVLSSMTTLLSSSVPWVRLQVRPPPPPCGLWFGVWNSKAGSMGHLQCCPSNHPSAVCCGASCLVSPSKRQVIRPLSTHSASRTRVSEAHEHPTLSVSFCRYLWVAPTLKYACAW